ncbi:MAG: hypothetical protein ACLU5I_05260 [Alistipes finegoldii]|nr:MAG TPA: protein of unknown function (DUF1082) [Microviridae sp.]
MYKKKKITYPSCFSEDSSSSCEYNPFVDKVVVARPMSYYLNGGVDLDGVSTRKPLPDAFDDAESIASGDVDVFTDPTVSRLDLMDMASIMASESESRALKDGAGEPNSD